MEKAKEIIEDVSSDMIGMYDVKEYEEELNTLMRLHARDEGRMETKLEIAKTMIESGEKIELISKYTGLSKDEIEKLK